MSHPTATVRLTETALLRAVGTLRDAVMERPARTELALLRRLYERLLGAGTQAALDGADLRRAVDTLGAAVLERPTRERLEGLLHCYERMLAVRAARAA
jgi:hypothetical protein